MLASNRGTLMELGISPIVNSGLMMQLVQGMKILDIDMRDEDDVMLYKAAQKLGGIFITIILASVYVFTGMFGSIQSLGMGNATIIIFQLFLAGVVVLLLDELLQKYGMGSGISLFISTGICTNIIHAALSPRSVKTMGGEQYQGAIINLFHLLVTKTDKISALKEAFYRRGAYNITNLLSTVIVLLLVIYLQGFKKEIKISQSGNKFPMQPFPIKLFYTSNMPIILQSTVTANMYQISKVLYNNFSHIILIRWLGEWNGGMPVGGLVKYISAPRTMRDIFMHPEHTLFYIAFMLGTCAYFSVIWVEVQQQTAKDIAKRWAKDKIVIGQGGRGGAKEIENNMHMRYIRTATILGGMCVGGLTIIADFLGVIGSGTGILLAVSNIFEYMDTYKKEMRENAKSKGNYR